MRKFIYVAILALLSTTVHAAERTEAQMRQIALEQLGKNHPAMAKAWQRKAVQSPTLTISYSDEHLEVFSSEGYGSVLVSRDDRFAPVLGYTNGIIANVESLPCAMQWWLKDISAQMAETTATAESKAYGVEQATSAAYAETAPFVTTKWGQDTPYNSFCPKILDTRPPSGCVATAMAQILNYNQYPASVSFTGSYTLASETDKNTEKIATSYIYPYQTAYGEYSTDGSATLNGKIDYNLRAGINVGKLVRDCGYSVNMNYTLGGSGTTSYAAAVAAINVFSYPAEAVKHYMRAYYTDDEWHNIVYNEIASGYPVLYSGVDNTNGGHAFVAHGIDADGLVAVNWGWQGAYDGYYAMDAMNPRSNSFTTNQMIVTGWHPSALSTDSRESQWVAEGITFTHDATTGAYNFGASGMFNVSINDFEGDVDMIFEDVADGSLEALTIVEDSDGTFAFGYGFSLEEQDISSELDFLQNGHTYKVYITSQTASEAQPQRMRTKGGRFYYMLTIAADGTVTIGDAEIDTTSAIRNARHEDHRPSGTYNLKGQRVPGDAKGLVIVNGAKILRK